MKDKPPISFVLAALSTKPNDSGNWKTLAMAVPLLFWEAGISYLHIMGHLPLVFLFTCHFIVVVFMAAFVWYQAIRLESIRYPLVLLIALTGAAAFGIIGFLLFALIYVSIRSSSTPADQWIDELFPKLSLATQGVYERIHIGWDKYLGEEEVTPFRDIFLYGTLLQKQNVLDAIVEDYRSEYSPILKVALKDSRNSVRIQAAAIASKLEYDFMEKLHGLLRERQENPKDPQVVLRLAQLYDRHAYGETFQIERAEENRAFAQQNYETYLEMSPKDEAIWVDLGRILVRSSDTKAIRIWFNKYERAFADVGYHYKPLALSWYLEALYRSGEFDELATLVAAIQWKPLEVHLSPEFLEVVDYWRDHGS